MRFNKTTVSTWVGPNTGHRDRGLMFTVSLAIGSSAPFNPRNRRAQLNGGVENALDRLVLTCLQSEQDR